MFWIKYELRRICKDSEGFVTGTQILGHRWFAAGRGPECYVSFKEGDMEVSYCSTSDSQVSRNQPENSV